jgi:transposase
MRRFAHRGKLLGIVFVELNPYLDQAEMTQHIAVQLLIEALATAACLPQAHQLGELTQFKRHGNKARSNAFWDVERLDSLSRDELIQVILDQQRIIEQLRAEIEQLKRRSSAAPFSKGTHKSNPKKAGRKPGQGSFRRRTEPKPSAGQEPIVVPVNAECCPECGGPLGECRDEKVSVTDVPLQPQPQVQVYAVQVRRCQRCGKPVRGQHPDIAKDQQGATAHRLGPQVKALAHLLHYEQGVPVRKVPAIIAELTGVRLTQGAITQDA